MTTNPSRPVSDAGMPAPMRISTHQKNHTRAQEKNNSFCAPFGPGIAFAPGLAAENHVSRPRPCFSRPVETSRGTSKTTPGKAITDRI
jgi:hypothetical protein